MASKTKIFTGGEVGDEPRVWPAPANMPPPPTRSSPHDLEAQSGRPNIEFTLKASKPVVLNLKPVDYSRVLVSDPTALYGVCLTVSVHRPTSGKITLIQNHNSSPTVMNL